MNGIILNFSVTTNSGQIKGHDNSRYHFQGTAWRENSQPQKAMAVDFEIDTTTGEAIDIFSLDTDPGNTPPQNSKTANHMIGYALFSLIISSLCLLTTFCGYRYSLASRDDFGVIVFFIHFITASLITALATLKNHYAGTRMAMAALIISVIAVFMALP